MCKTLIHNTETLKLQLTMFLWCLSHRQYPSYWNHCSSHFGYLSYIKQVLSGSYHSFHCFCNTERVPRSLYQLQNPVTKFHKTDSKPTRSRQPSGLSSLSKFSISQGSCPNAKWVIECIASVLSHLVMTTYLLGKPLTYTTTYQEQLPHHSGGERWENWKNFQGQFIILLFSCYWEVRIYLSQL